MAGFLSVTDKDRIQSVIKQAKRYGYLPSDIENVHSLVECMESTLFNSTTPIMFCVSYYLLNYKKNKNWLQFLFIVKAAV